MLFSCPKSLFATQSCEDSHVSISSFVPFGEIEMQYQVKSNFPFLIIFWICSSLALMWLFLLIWYVQSESESQKPFSPSFALHASRKHLTTKIIRLTCEVGDWVTCNVSTQLIFWVNQTGFVYTPMFPIGLEKHWSGPGQLASVYLRSMGQPKYQFWIVFFFLNIFSHFLHICTSMKSNISYCIE